MKNLKYLGVLHKKLFSIKSWKSLTIGTYRRVSWLMVPHRYCILHCFFVVDRIPKWELNARTSTCKQVDFIVNFREPNISFYREWKQELFLISVNFLLLHWGTIKKSWGALTPNFGRYVSRQSEKWGALERVEHENAGLRSGLECTNAGLWRGFEREMGFTGADL